MLLTVNLGSGFIPSKKPATRAPRVVTTAAVLGEEATRSEEHTSELQSLRHLVCRLLLEKNTYNKPRYPKRPILGIGALIFNRGKILLVERGKDPFKGHRSPPGSLLLPGETL